MAKNKKMENEFKELNEQLKIWNTEIDAMNRNIMSVGNLIRVVPALIKSNEDAERVDNLLEESALRLTDKMPIITYSLAPKKSPLLRFDYPNPETHEIFGGKYKISRVSNGCFVTNISCARFSKDGNSVGIAGNSFFFAINLETRTDIASWFAVSESAPNNVIDMDWNASNAAILMQDNFIRVFSYASLSITHEFPSFIENPTFVRLLYEQIIIIANDNGNIIIQSLDNMNKQTKVIFDIGKKPIDCFAKDGEIFVKTEDDVYKIVGSESIINIGPNEKNESIEVSYSNDKFFLKLGEETSDVVIPGVIISTATISQSRSCYLVSIGTREGCFFLWKIAQNVNQ